MPGGLLRLCTGKLPTGAGGWLGGVYQRWKALACRAARWDQCSDPRERPASPSDERVASAVPPNATVLLVATICVAAILSSPAQAQSCTVTNASGSYGNINVLSAAGADTPPASPRSCTGNP